MLSEFIKWSISAGTASVVLMFFGAFIWRYFYGTKTEKGLFDRDGLRRAKHEAEQTEMGKDERAAMKSAEVSAFNNATSLHVLVESETPPEGAAYIAQALVAKTAVTVDQIQMMGNGFVNIVRLFAAQYPDVEDKVNAYCDDMDREVKRSTDDLLQEQEKAKNKIKREA